MKNILKNNYNHTPCVLYYFKFLILKVPLSLMCFYCLEFKVTEDLFYR
jgi:hypothetical protein